MTKTRSSFAAVALSAAIFAGCSGESARQTLTAPSSVPETVAVSPVSTGDRTKSVRAAQPGEVREWASRTGWAAAADGLVVEGTDTITAVSDACPTKVITVRGVPVAVTATTTFTAPMTCEALAVDTTVTVTALLTFSATGLTVTATNIAPAGADGGSDGETGEPGTGGPGSGKKARGEGVIGAITGSCPTLTLVITGTRVSTTATTEYVNGTCDTLRPGTKVTIDGELKPGGTATAEKIEIHRVPGRPVSGDGVVGQATGTCPSLTLMVRGVTVMTSSATTFTGGSCEDIKPGTDIDVTGDYDGSSVGATAVHIKRQR
jgi:hypothetical protein